MELKIAFFASHNGSNVKAILDKIEKGTLNASAKIIISNNPDALVLCLGQERGIPNYCLNEKNTDNLDDEILKILKEHEVNFIVLAGYMKKISEKIIKQYSNRIINIHPALLPKYGGKNMYGSAVHNAVIASKDKESGATIHVVTEEYDKGRILSQEKILRHEYDTAETLAQRVLEIEHKLYFQTLKDIQEGKIILDS